MQIKGIFVFKPYQTGGEPAGNKKEDSNMAFFNSAITVLQTLVVALGAGLGIWGAINLLEGYGNDNPGAKSQGMKQLMAGGGVARSARRWYRFFRACLVKTREVTPFEHNSRTDYGMAQRDAH